MECWALMTVPRTGRGVGGKYYPSRALTVAERLHIARRVHQLRCASGLTVEGVRAALAAEGITRSAGRSTPRCTAGAARTAAAQTAQHRRGTMKPQPKACIALHLNGSPRRRRVGVALTMGRRGGAAAVPGTHPTVDRAVQRSSGAVPRPVRPWGTAAELPRAATRCPAPGRARVRVRGVRL